MSVPRLGAAGSALCLAALLAPTPAQGQELDTSVTVASGTGLSLGRGSGGVLRQRSPIFLELDVGLCIDGDHAWEWTPSVLLELEGTVSVGVNPSLKRFFHWRRFGFYGGIGIPFIFAPFTLLGVEPALGATFRLTSRLALALEVRADVFFVGSDLSDGSVLAKLDLALGLRLDL